MKQSKGRETKENGQEGQETQGNPEKATKWTEQKQTLRWSQRSETQGKGKARIFLCCLVLPHDHKLVFELSSPRWVPCARVSRDQQAWAPPALETTHCLCLRPAPPAVLQASRWAESFPCFLPCCPPLEGACDYAGPTRVIWSNLPILNSTDSSLTSTCKCRSSLPRKVKCAQVPGTRTWTSSGDQDSAHHAHQVWVTCVICCLGSCWVCEPWAGRSVPG